jgi:transcriptional regulator of NAD metabolism
MKLHILLTKELSDIIDLNLYSLNDMTDELILKDGGCLSDINYKIVGCIPATDKHNGYIILNVNADVSELL